MVNRYRPRVKIKGKWHNFAQVHSFGKKTLATSFIKSVRKSYRLAGVRAKFRIEKVKY